MQLSQNIRATRVTGTLDIDLEDGRTATLEVDLDVSDPDTAWGVDHDYVTSDMGLTRSLTQRVATTFSVKIPVNLRHDEGGMFTLRIPVGD